MIREIPEEHKYNCSVCGQDFDMRNLSEVIHHAQNGHDPLNDKLIQPFDVIEIKGVKIK